MCTSGTVAFSHVTLFGAFDVSLEEVGQSYATDLLKKASHTATAVDGHGQPLGQQRIPGTLGWLVVDVPAKPAARVRVLSVAQGTPACSAGRGRAGAGGQVPG